MTELVFFLEEPSAREMLKGVLKNLIPEDITVRYVVFQGKQDLHKRLGLKLRGWLVPSTRFVVLRDKDSSDCVVTKNQLLHICQQAGKEDVLIRIACHELESWYLGDLNAVEEGLQINGLARKQNRRNYRDPDRIASPSQELKHLTKERYQKVGGSRKIGPYLSLDANRSHSFNVFISGISQLVEEIT